MIIEAKVHPGSKKTEIKRIANNLYTIHVTANPEDGKANKAIIKLLAKYFKVPASLITIEQGITSSKKIIKIDCEVGDGTR